MINKIALLIITVLLIFCGKSMTYSQVNPPDTSPVFTIVETQPRYSFGESRMFYYLRSNISYPENARSQKIEGTVIVSFIVEKDGKLTNMSIVKGIIPELDNEALRVVGTMQNNWIPGYQSGKPVRVKMMIPVDFRLNYVTNSDYTEYRPRYDHGDSIYHNSRYYSPEQYRKIKKEEEKNEFESYFLPGLGFSVYKPKNSDSVGIFSGLVVEYLIVASVYQNDKPGPSHVRFYARLNMMKSSKADISNLFFYSLGLDLSLEKNPNRTWMVPYFGLEAGGMSGKQTGTAFQFTPILGLHLISKKNIFINIHGGYIYPLKEFDNFQGWFGQAGLNFALW